MSVPFNYFGHSTGESRATTRPTRTVSGTGRLDGRLELDARAATPLKVDLTPKTDCAISLVR